MSAWIYWHKIANNMPTVDISETNTWQMEREFTKLYIEPQNWWVWGRLRQSDQHCLFFSYIGCLWMVVRLYIRPLLKNIVSICVLSQNCFLWCTMTFVLSIRCAFSVLYYMINWQQLTSRWTQLIKGIVHPPKLLLLYGLPTLWWFWDEVIFRL